jgi:hypothetical protein
MPFLSEFAQGMQIARENHEREQSRNLAEKRAAAQDSLALKNFDLQTFLANLASGKDIAASQTGKVHEGNDQGVVSAPNTGTSSAKGGTFEVSGGVPVITPPSPVKVKGAPSIGIEDVMLPVQSVEEVQRNKDTAAKSEDERALELFEKQQGIRDKNENITVGEDSPLLKHGLKPGVYKPQEITAYVSLENAEEARKSRIQAKQIAAQQSGDTQKALQFNKDMARASVLRDDYKGEIAYKQYATVLPQMSIITSSAKDPSGASDMALIFSYMKLLDPGSTVREGEYATAKNVGSIPQRVWAKYNVIVNGQKFSAEQRADFLKSAKTTFKSYQTEKSHLDKIYKERSGRAQVNPDDVVTPDSDLGSNEDPTASAPVQKAPTGTFSFIPDK